MIAKKLASLMLVGALLVAPPAAAAMQGKPGAPSAGSTSDLTTFVVGRWTDNGDCSDYVDFLPDGRFITSAGASGRWTVSGNRLTFSGTQTITATVSRTGPNSISLTHDDGSTGGSTRCAAPAAAAVRLQMPAMPQTLTQALAMSRPATRAYLLGRWTDDGDCSNIIDFHADGRFTISAGGAGRWTLNGDTLTFIGNTTIVARARAVGPGRILLIRQEGTIGQSLRCPS